jgi:cellulose synthase/poly-beta-1,6-N-acetylglucosamine synthase-like glycosyltransferase
MFPGLSIYFFMVVLIFWAYCGSIWLLFLFYVLSPSRCQISGTAEVFPKMAVLVPCHNEDGLLAQKVQNLKELQYPEDKLLVYFLDGRSTDGTPETLRGLVQGLPHWHVVDTDVSGKITQLNVGLALLPEDVEVVVNTDMDTLLEHDVLVKFAAELESDPRIMVLGANVSPNGCIAIERVYWEGQNTLRILESAVYASSIVVAPCYAFRRELLDSFPDDCVADDIHVAFKANTQGYITRYVTEAKGRETRTPATLESFLNHKFRKGNAFLQELLRFLYMLPSMTSWWKIIYLTKLLQLAVIPWLLPYFILSTLSFLLSGGGLFKVAVFSCSILAVCFVVSSLAVNRFKKVHFNGSRAAHRGIMVPFLFANLILVLVGLSYPFYRQNSQYERIAQQ